MTEDTGHCSENATIVPENYSGKPTATVSSLKSEDSTEQLISKSSEKKVKNARNVKEKSVSSKNVEAGSEAPSHKRRVVVVLGLCQVVLGALLVGAGATAVVRGASLSRTGAGLWAGCIAVVAGVVGVLAGINDCYGLSADNSGPLLTAFLALSLLCLACGNSAAVLAATGLQRDALRSQPTHSTFEDEMQAWNPVLANIALLIIATLHCLVCIISIYHLSKRVCPCFRPKQPFDHNQFDPTFKAAQSYVMHVDEVKKVHDAEKIKNHELCKELEEKLQGESLKKKKAEPEAEFGSENSKEKLVSRWLGRHQGSLTAPPAAGRPRRASGVRKPRRPRPPPVVLLPAHPASTLGRVTRVPVNLVVPPRYATLPLPPAAYVPPPTIYYPLPDNRVRRRRSPRSPRAERRKREAGRERESQLTRSLERIHRKRRAERERMSEADLKRTYTGLDREYAEQFIAVCDESRHAAEQHDSLASTSATSDSSRTNTQRDSM